MQEHYVSKITSTVWEGHPLTRPSHGFDGSPGSWVTKCDKGYRIAPTELSLNPIKSN